MPLPALGGALWHLLVPKSPQGNPRGSLARGDPKTPPIPPLGAPLGAAYLPQVQQLKCPAPGWLRTPVCPLTHRGDAGAALGAPRVGTAVGDTLKLR